MNISEINSKWKSKVINTEASINLWDIKAKNFGVKELPTVENSIALRIIEKEKMVQVGKNVLDVGCGGGRFSFALSNKGVDVLGIDFSVKMIEVCEKAKERFSSKADFAVCDWEKANLADLGWGNKFELVLANMTPAVSCVDGFLKLSCASKGWCIMVKPIRRKNSVLDKLVHILGKTSVMPQSGDSILYAFELLYLDGYNPKIEYENQMWNHTLTLNEAIEEYTLRIETSHVLTKDDKVKITNHLKSIAVGGNILEVTEVTIAALYWNVNKKES